MLAIDQGTTSTRAIAFDLTEGVGLATRQRELPQSYPESGWVEHDAERIRDDAVAVASEVIQAVEAEGRSVAAIGINSIKNESTPRRRLDVCAQERRRAWER